MPFVKRNRLFFTSSCLLLSLRITGRNAGHCMMAADSRTGFQKYALQHPRLHIDHILYRHRHAGIPAFQHHSLYKSFYALTIAFTACLYAFLPQVAFPPVPPYPHEPDAITVAGIAFFHIVHRFPEKQPKKT